MSDTQRSLAALLALLPDNVSGQISPQDIRDIVETLRINSAKLYISASASTAIAQSSTFYKAAGTTALEDDPPAKGFTMPENNRLKYTGAAQRVVLLLASVSLSVDAGANQEIRLRVAKNGTTLDHSEVRRVAATATDVGAAQVVCLTTMEQDDYIELWVANETAANDLTIEAMSFVALALAY